MRYIQTTRTIYRGTSVKVVLFDNVQNKSHLEDNCAISKYKKTWQVSLLSGNVYANVYTLEIMNL